MHVQPEVCLEHEAPFARLRHTGGQVPLTTAASRAQRGRRATCAPALREPSRLRGGARRGASGSSGASCVFAGRPIRAAGGRSGPSPARGRRHAAAPQAKTPSRGGREGGVTCGSSKSSIGQSTPISVEPRRRARRIVASRAVCELRCQRRAGRRSVEEHLGRISSLSPHAHGGVATLATRANARTSVHSCTRVGSRDIIRPPALVLHASPPPSSPSADALSTGQRSINPVTARRHAAKSPRPRGE